MIKISAVVSAFNEEDKIARCLESLSFCQEIIVVDNQSTDKTVKLAKKHGAKVFSRPNNSMLNINKNFGFSKAINEWILNLDADEAVSFELKKEIEGLSPNLLNVAFQIPRQNIIFGKWIKHSLWWPDYQIRLFKKNHGKFACIHVHEKISVTGEIADLTGHLIHYNYETVSQFIQKMDKIYTTNEAECLATQKKTLRWFDALWLPINDFFKTFFLQKGYRDGLHGLVLSLLQAFYSLVIFAKYWEINKFKIEEPKNFPHAVIAEITKIGKDFRYWLTTLEIEETTAVWKKTILRSKRKLGL